ncbi:MAG: chemotaxis protein CheW [Planctomycetaceae bacterium]
MNASTATRHCTFRVGDHCLAVEADAVAEVLGTRVVTRVPLAPAGVLGLIHVRGRIVPILDPAVRLGLPVPADRRAAAHLVLQVAADDWVGLLVDEVLDVVEIPAAAVERPHAAEADAAVTGVFAAHDRLVHLIDCQSLVRTGGRQRTPPSSTSE